MTHSSVLSAVPSQRAKAAGEEVEREEVPVRGGELIIIVVIRGGTSPSQY
jgi:hypothetical protein